MSEEPSLDETSGMSQPEMEIHHFFSRHLNTLVSQKWTLMEQISQWSSTLIGLVQQHSTQQRDLVEQECTKKMSRLKTLRDQCLQQISIYEEKKDLEPIHQLLDQCHTLKIQLGTLAQIDRLIPSIQYITEEQQKLEDEQSIEFQTNDHTDTNVSPVSIQAPSDESQSIDDVIDVSEKCPICFMIFPQTRTIYQRNLHVNEHYTDD